MRITSINQNCCRNSPLLAGLSFLALVHSVSSSVKNSKTIFLLSQHFTVKITEYVVEGKLLVKFIIKLKLARLYYNLLLFFSSGNQLQSFYFCFYKIFCSTFNSLSQDRIATSSCLHFHFDQVFKMSCSLVTPPTAVVVERLKIGKV